MTRTSKQTTTHNGFAIPLQPDTDLGLATPWPCRRSRRTPACRFARFGLQWNAEM